MTSSNDDHIAAYNDQAETLAAEYEVLDPTDYRQTFSELLPQGESLIALDVGAGSGRDAAWLASLGYDVVAVEPSSEMRRIGRKLHTSAKLRWLDDRMPGLEATHALGIAFDFVLLSAVWQHVAPTERRRAFRKLATLLKPGGLLVLTLRIGPAPANRPMHAVSVGEVEQLARDFGLAVTRVQKHPAGNFLRPGVDWITIAMVMLDDGAAALPLLRGIILADDKSATYKLGLLRSIAKVADLTPGLARPSQIEDAMELPLGAVALNWIRMYLPLLSRGFPQMPGNSGPDGLSFAKVGFRALLDGSFAPLDLRVGAAFSGERATAVTAALKEAGRTIATMPANFIRYPNSSSRVFEAALASARMRGSITLDAATLAQFGQLTVPGSVWRAMQRLGSWIEPVLVAEWARMVHRYAERQGASIAPGAVEAALTWHEPKRDVGIVRELATARLASGESLLCVWSGRSLSDGTLDVDHCLPWSAWACGDLWNLLPAHRIVNQRQKRDLLPSSTVLDAARQAITSWWEETWLNNPVLRARFEREAEAALPIGNASSSEAIFDGLAWRRLRLQQDQRLPEWAGPRQKQVASGTS